MQDWKTKVYPPSTFEQTTNHKSKQCKDAYRGHCPSSLEQLSLLASDLVLSLLLQPSDARRQRPRPLFALDLQRVRHRHPVGAHVVFALAMCAKPELMPQRIQLGRCSLELPVERKDFSLLSRV